MKNLLGWAITVAALLTGSGLFWSGNGPRWMAAPIGRQSAAPTGMLPAFHCSATPCESGRLRVATINLMCRYCQKPSYPRWAERAKEVRHFIVELDADLIGLQELVSSNDLKALLPRRSEWEFATPNVAGWPYADAAILFRRDRFEVLDAGVVWLGRNPTLPFSARRFQSFPRYINWVRLNDVRRGFQFLFVNTHFDNNSANNGPSARLFRDTVQKLRGLAPIIAVGDFNIPRADPNFATLTHGVLADTKDLVSPLTVGAGYSREVEHIFVAADGIRVESWIRDSGHGRRSDHAFVVADVRLREEPGR